MYEFARTTLVFAFRPDGCPVSGADVSLVRGNIAYMFTGEALPSRFLGGSHCVGALPPVGSMRRIGLPATYV